MSTHVTNETSIMQATINCQITIKCYFEMRAGTDVHLYNAGLLTSFI